MSLRRVLAILFALLIRIAICNEPTSLSHSEGHLPAGQTHGQENTMAQAFTLKDVFFHEFSTENGAPRMHTLSSSCNSEARAILSQHKKSQAGLNIRSRPMRISRQRHGVTSTLQQNAANSFAHEVQDTNASQWDTVLVPGPDLTDKDTVVNLGKMCSDAYINAPTQPDWLNTTLGFNHSYSFGWKGDGLRGHIFTDNTNETVIVAFKGTTFDPGHFKDKDRLNDNLLFSCCCATQRPDPFWYGRVCDCRTDNYQCNSTCLTQELIQEDRYYPTALAIMKNVTTWYHNATVWTVGHSLGGAIASLIGLTYNIPSVSIEAPPQKLAAQRLGLTIPPHSADYHIGNTADPVYMGACNGYFSTCSIAGYAFESQCHTGKRCVYDTVQDKGWRVSITNHRIHTVITQVLEAYNTTPACEADDECVDCFNWNFTSHN